MSARPDGYRLLEDWQRPGNPDGSHDAPQRRDHPVTVKLPSALYARLRAECKASGHSLSAVVRLALDAGLPTVEAERRLRTLELRARAEIAEGMTF